MRVLFDTNVVLDVLLDRQPHVAASAAAWGSAETGEVEGVLGAHAVTTLHYLIRKNLGDAKARDILASILRVFDVAAVDGAVIQAALQLKRPDFEDAVTAVAAQSAECDWIVTRDTRGFRGSPVAPLLPEALVALGR